MVLATGVAVSNEVNNAWEVLHQETVFNHAFMSVAMETVRLPDGTIIEDWPKVYTRDYVNALVFNEAGEALILEGYKHGNGQSNWQMVGGYLEEGEDPVTAVKRELLEETGHSCKKWFYLGSYVVDANRHVGIGHFFCAQGAQPITEINHGDLEEMTLKWVSFKELKYALLDGRISVISYAMTVALSMLLVEQIIGPQKGSPPAADTMQ
jgi:ADP-ribose pyrophosphatase